MITDNLTELVRILQAQGMKVGDWITLAAVLVALGLGVASLMQTHILRKRERKERLLNEIIEWAEDVATCQSAVNIPEPSPIFSRLYEKELMEYGTEDKQKLLQGIMQDQKRFWLYHFMNLHSNYQSLGAKGEYILSLSDTKYFGSITDTVRKVKAQIGNYENDLFEYMKNMDDTSRRDKQEDTFKNLHRISVELMKEAAKIKTKDIGMEENVPKEVETTVSNEPTNKDIEEHLKRQDRQMARTQWQFPFSLGVSAMAVGLTWFIATTPITQGDFKSGLLVFFVGVLIVVLSLFYRYRNKS